jgi:hypothetical protein
MFNESIDMKPDRRHESNTGDPIGNEKGQDTNTHSTEQLARFHGLNEFHKDLPTLNHLPHTTEASA